MGVTGPRRAYGRRVLQVTMLLPRSFWSFPETESRIFSGDSSLDKCGNNQGVEGNTPQVPQHLRSAHPQRAH
jgi:hypothetical protein